MTEEERALGKRHVAVWKETAEELDRLKWEELRALAEEKAAEIFIQLDVGNVATWRGADRTDGSGLVEQQSWFRKAHEARTRP